MNELKVCVIYLFDIYWKYSEIEGVPWSRATFTELGGRVSITESSQKNYLYTKHGGVGKAREGRIKLFRETLALY